MSTEIKLNLDDPSLALDALEVAQADARHEQDTAGATALADLRAQISAQLPKAPVEEPTERWSVVEATDVDGRRSEWGLLKDATTYPWVTVGSDGTPYWADWKHLTDPEVLRVGVGEPATPPAEAVEADEVCPRREDHDGCTHPAKAVEADEVPERDGVLWGPGGYGYSTSGNNGLSLAEPTPEQVEADLAQDEQAHARYYAQPGVPVEKVREVAANLRADAKRHGEDIRHPRVVLENRAADLERLLPEEPTS